MTAVMPETAPLTPVTVHLVSIFPVTFTDNNGPVMYICLAQLRLARWEFQ